MEEEIRVRAKVTRPVCACGKTESIGLEVIAYPFRTDFEDIFCIHCGKVFDKIPIMFCSGVPVQKAVGVIEYADGWIPIAMLEFDEGIADGQAERNSSRAGQS